MAKKDTENSDGEGPLIDDNVIRIQFRKPNHRKWELRTRNLSGVKFPTIQLFDCEGNLLVETNDENISIKSSDYDDGALRTSQSLREQDFRHYITKRPLRKNNTISGDQIYTRIYRVPEISDSESKDRRRRYVVKNYNSIIHIPSTLSVRNTGNLAASSIETSPAQSRLSSRASSLKSSDNEMNDNSICQDDISCLSNGVTIMSCASDTTINNERNLNNQSSQEIDEDSCPLRSRLSFSSQNNSLYRPESRVGYNPPHNKVPFLSTYLKSLPKRNHSNPDWIAYRRSLCRAPQSRFSRQSSRYSENELTSHNSKQSDYDYLSLPSDVAAERILRNRLRMYRRGISEAEGLRALDESSRRHSEGYLVNISRTSSSESVDEADVVLNRLKRRIQRNRTRNRHGSGPRKRKSTDTSSDGWQDVASMACGAAARLGQRRAMGANISQHSSKGLKGRRARSSGDLCNGDTKSQSESSVCGSVVGDVMGWNRSLPNHLDGNRHLADYSLVNNNYGDFGSYSRYLPKAGRGLRYRVSKSGAGADPVWKLQDAGCDQGYGSERSPEDDYLRPIQLQPPVPLHEYEEQLRAAYPFIDDENTFTVVVEKDGRGLGMSVCGGGGLVRIRRLYPPQPAWKTGRLAPRDLLLAANGVPLAGLSTYEALEVLRTAPARVELRVCRPPAGAAESVTPPEPPPPPARAHPPPDPLNCHPMHARLSATTSSATTSSSEGRGRREGSPEDRRDLRDLRLPGLERPLPVYDVQYGEFDIVMTKVGGSLGFTLRKEDHSALGHYVRALVREPALSDGRIQPGDRIVAVNDTAMSNMSHAEAVAFLRACDSEVRLRLYRDHAATPLSPMSPKDEGPTDSDGPLNKPKPPLRAEAVSMLCDLAARRLTPDAVDGSRSPCLSPRKFRRLTKDNNHYESQNDVSRGRVRFETGSPEKRFVASTSRASMKRAQSLTLVSPTASHCYRKTKLSLTVPPHGYELNSLDSTTLDGTNYQEDMRQQRFPEPVFNVDSNEPMSMPVALSSEGKFKHASPAYQSAVLHTTSTDAGSNSDTAKDDGKGLKKWKGVTLSPDKERKAGTQPPPKKNEAVQKENIKPEPKEVVSSEPTIVSVELTRGWNSRLGFSVQSHPDSGQSYISAVYSDSVAARDGRLRRGDVILQVNDENVTSMKTPEVIDLLRILRGSICITVLRPPAQ